MALYISCYVDKKLIQHRHTHVVSMLEVRFLSKINAKVKRLNFSIIVRYFLWKLSQWRETLGALSLFMDRNAL